MDWVMGSIAVALGLGVTCGLHVGYHCALSRVELTTFILQPRIRMLRSSQVDRVIGALLEM
jgi:hypothetical protein